MSTQTLTPKTNNFLSLSWLILLILALLWGSSFILMKKAVAVYSPIQVGSLRIFLAGLISWILIFFQWKKIPFQILPLAAIGGIVGNLIPSWLFSIAGKNLDSSVSGILNAATPLFTFTIGWIVFGRKGTLAKIIGILIGLAGCILLITVNANGEFALNYYALLPVIATLLYGFHYNFYKSYLNTAPPIPTAYLVMATAGIPAGIVLFSTNFIETTLHQSNAPQALGYVGILALFGSVIGTMLSNKLNQMASPLMVSSVTYLLPIVSVGWGLLDGETLNVMQIVGMLVIVAGVFVVNKAK
jgi:drug/metabolite transporter (DMT)-like permease